MNEWQSGIDSCLSLTNASSTDWRLPTPEEAQYAYDNQITDFPRVINTSSFLTSSSTPSLAVWFANLGNYYFAIQNEPKTGYVANTLCVYDSETPPPPSYAPRFTSFYVSTSTHTAFVSGYWVPSTSLHFYQDSDIYGQENYQEITATGTGAFSLALNYTITPPPSYVSTTTPQITANNNFYAELYDTSTDPISLLDATSTTASGGVIGGYDLSSTTAILNYPEPESCGITNLAGCFKNALVWAFFPSKQTLQNFQNLGTYITIKAPIGYFTLIKNAFTGLSAGGTGTATITIPKHLRDTIFHPFDLAIGALLWFFFITHFYKRLKIIQI